MYKEITTPIGVPENNFISSILLTKTPFYFISPHLDDAVLSAGDLILFLIEQKIPVTVITVFTKISPKPYTLSAKSFIRQCGYNDAELLFADRRSEDKEIFKKIGIQTEHFDFVDATWRKKENISSFRKILSRFIPELGHRYPIHQLNVISGKIVPEDQLLIDEVGSAISKIIGENNDCRIFAPAAFGNHVDHTLARKVCAKYFPGAILWSDFPYNTRESGSIKIEGYEQCEWSNNPEGKIALIKEYKTQFQAMFSGGIPRIPEIFYIPKGQNI